MNFASKLYDRIMGSPWIYDGLRPLLLGGFDFAPVYGWLAAGPDDVIVDVGCGTGHAMEFLAQFREYHGFDLDRRSLERFRSRHPSSKITLHERELTAKDVGELKPSKVVLMGLFHHLSDPQVRELLATLAHGTSITRLVTLDPVYVTGRWTNNFLGFMDRGRHVRREEGYRALLEGTPFGIHESRCLTSNNGVAIYYAMCLTPVTEVVSR